jgi:hypothetical protein
MGRNTVMWDGQPYDYAVLYDVYGRQVSDFFPAGDVGPPPTLPPVNPSATIPSVPTPEPGKPTPTNVPGQPTNTVQVPTPQSTKPATVTGASPTPTGSSGSDSTPTPTGAAASPTPTATRQAGCAEIMVNGDFENYYQNWEEQTNTDSDLITNDQPHQGTYGAFLGYFPNADDNLWQVVTIPGTASRVDLTYWKRMDTDDNSGQDHDFGYVQIRNQAGGDVLRTLETISNSSTADTWQQSTYSLLDYKGQTIRIQFHATTDTTIASDFFFDDVSLQACP